MTYGFIKKGDQFLELNLRRNHMVFIDFNEFGCNSHHIVVTIKKLCTTYGILTINSDHLNFGLHC